MFPQKHKSTIFGLFHARLRYLLVVGMFFVSALSIFALNNSSQTVEAATPSELNFQARLYNADGSTVDDGYYNIEFNIYNVDTGGTTQWTEEYYDSNGPSAGNDNRLRVVNGYFSANLGSITAFSGIDWDEEQWLTINVGGSTQTATPTYDGEMTPRIKLTSVPYAFVAGAITDAAGNTQFTADDLIQDQNSGDQTANFRISGTGRANTSFTTPLLDSISGVLGIGTTTATGVNIGGTTNTTSVVLQGAATSTYTIGTSNNTGGITLGNSTATNTISIGSAAGASNTQTINIGTSATGSSTTNITLGSTAGGVTTLQSVGGVDINTNTSVSGSLALEQGTDFSTTGTSNDVDFGTVSLVRLTGASAQTITGIANGTDGELLTIVNAAGQSATISNQSGSSTAANRIITGTGADLTLFADASISLVYDNTSQRWRVAGSAVSVAGANATLQTAYDASTGGTTPEIKLDSTRGALDIQDADTTIGGSLLTVRASNGGGLGSALFDINSTGQTTFQNSTNSTTAFEVQNAAGGSLFNIDSTDSGNITLLGNNSGETSSWTASSTLPANRSITGVTHANGYIYAIGGEGGSGGTTTSYYAKVNADGSVDSWNSTTALPAARRDHTVVHHNGYIYVIGGATDGVTAVSTVYHSKINDDGTLGSWSTTSSLPAIRMQHSSVVHNGYVYAIGGYTTGPNTWYSTVYYAKINSNGTLGPWASTTSLTAVRSSHASITANGYLYVTGGQNGSSYINTFYYGKINDDGTISSWSTNGNNFSSDNGFHGLGVSNGHIYIIGGYDGTNYIDSVEYAQLNANGSSGSFTTSSHTLAADRGSPGYATINGYLYAVGGYDSSSYTNTTYYASTARVTIGGNLDLVGLSGENLYEGGTGGSITAGNGTFVGTLDVQQQANFWDNLYIEGSLRVESESTTASLNVGSVSGNRLFSDNFESGSFGLWESTTGTPTVSTSNAYSGEYAMSVSSTNAAHYVTKTIGGTTTFYARANVYVDSASTDATLFSVYNNSDGFAASEITAYRNSDGTIRVYSGPAGADCVTGGSMALDQWHQIQFQVTIGNSGSCQITINGSTTSSGTVDTLATGNPDTFSAGTVSTTQTFDAYIDEISVDTQDIQEEGSLTVQDTLNVGGSATFSGSTLFQNANDSSEAFKVLNAAGTDILSVNTSSLTTIFGSGTNYASINSSSGLIYSQNSSASNSALLLQQDGDSNARFGLYYNGGLEWGSGSATRDLNLSRADTGVLQVSAPGGASNGATLRIKGSGSQGSQDLFEIQPDGSTTDLFSISATGALTSRNSTDSTTAFQIQNAGGTATLLTADTTNQEIEIDGSLLVSNSSSRPLFTASDRFVINNGAESLGNELENPGFEYNGADIANGWDYNSGGSIGTGADARNGNNYLTNTADGSNQTVASTAKYHAVTPGDVIYYEGYIKNSGGADGAGGFFLERFDEDFSSVGFSSGDTWNLPGTSYVVRSNTYTIPAGTHYVTLAATIRNTSTTGDWYFDDLYLKKVNERAPVNFQNSVDSTTAFQIQNAAGTTNLLTADTTNLDITIGVDQINTGSLALQAGTDFSTTGTNNDVDFGSVSLIRLTGASAQTITGIANGTDGELLTIINAASQSATISNESGSSTAANRIITGTGSDLTLLAGSSISLIYDSSASRWRVIGNAASLGGSNPTLQTAYDGSTGGLTPEITLDATRGALDVQAQSSTSRSWTKVSQATAGTIASGGTSSIAGVFSAIEYNGDLYVGTTESGSAEVYRYDGGTDWTKVSQATAGTIASGGTSSIDDIRAVAVHNGSLYIGTGKSNQAEVYRYDGGTTWTKVSQSTAGTIASGGTANINYVNRLISFNGNLYAGTEESGSAEIYRYDGGTTWTKVSQTTAGTIASGGTANIDVIGSMHVFNNQLYIGTFESTNAEIYRYDGGTDWTVVSHPTTAGSIGSQTNVNGYYALTSLNGELYAGTTKLNESEFYRYDGGDTWTLVSHTTPGTIISGETSGIDGINQFIQHGNSIYAGTFTNGTAEGEIYRYDGSSFSIVSQTTAGTIESGGTTGIGGIYGLASVGGYLYAGSWDFSTLAEVYRYDDNVLRVTNSDGTNGLFTVGNNGEVLFQNATDSDNAFNVQNAAGSSLFTVDSTNAGNISLLDNNNGELDAWTTQAAALPANRSDAPAVYANGYVYLIGGMVTGTSTPQDDVYYARVNADGSLGTFNSTSLLPADRWGGAAVYYNGYIYYTGGSENTSTAQDDVYYAKVNPDGTLGAWQTDSNLLPDGIRSHGSVAYSGYLYTFGGWNDAAAADDEVYYAKLNPDGSLGAWQTETDQLPAARYYPATAEANGYIYLAGGTAGGGTPEDDVYYAKLDPNGGINAFSSTTLISEAIWAASGAVSNGYLYVVGGIDATTTQADVYYAQLNSDGTIGDWVNSSNSLPAARDAGPHTLPVINGYIYYLGGWQGSSANDDVYYTSTARVTVGGNIDLVGSSGEYLSEGGTGGSITAGNGTFVGTLNVQDQTNLWDNVYVEGDLKVDSNVSVAGSLGLEAGTDFSTTGTSNNVDFGEVSLVRLTGASAQTITGVANGTDGEILTIINAASQTATISNESGSSTAANRITTGTGADLSLPTDASITLVYDTSASRWRITGSAPVVGGAAATLQSAYDGSLGGLTSEIVLDDTRGALDIQAGSSTNYGSEDWDKVSQSTAGTIASGGTSDINAVRELVEFNGSLYGSTDEGGGAEIYRYDGATTWTKVSQATAGTIASGGTSSIDEVHTMVVYEGNLYVGTEKADEAEIYRYDGGTTWTRISSSAGTIDSGDTANIDGVRTLAVNDGRLYAGTNETNDAEVYVYEGGTTWTKVSQATAGTIEASGTANIDDARSLVSYNGNLYLGTNETDNAEVYRYDGGTTWTEVSDGTLGGQIAASGTDDINTVRDMIVFDGELYIGTFDSTEYGEVYRYDGGDDWTMMFTAAGQPCSSGCNTFVNGIYKFAEHRGSLYVGVYEPNEAEVYRFDGGVGGWEPVIFSQGEFLSGGTQNIDGVHGLASFDGYLFAGTQEADDAEIYRYDNNVLNIATTNADASLFSVDYRGSVALQPVIDNSEVFNIQSASGNEILNVSTTNAGAITLFGDDNGETTEWRTSSNLLPGNLGAFREQTAYHNGYVYTVGGYDGGAAPLDVVYYAQVQANGEIGTWAATTSLPSIQADNAVVTNNGYIYSIGGTSAGFLESDNVYYAKLNSDGSVGEWKSGTNVTSSGARATSAVVYNDYIYIIGGNTETNEVYSAKINSDGSIGQWQSLNTLPASLSWGNALTANGYIYYIGGYTGSAAADEVYYAQLNEDGTIGSWSTQTAALPANINASSATVLNGYVYILGGDDGAGTPAISNSVYYAKLNTDGSLGTFYTSSHTLPGPRSQPTTFNANGRIYVIGGVSDSSFTVYNDDVFYTDTRKVTINASLDLVGSGGGSLSDGSGGSLTAGNTKVLGTLDVQGQANFNNSVSIQNNLVVGAALQVTGSSNPNEVSDVGGGAGPDDDIEIYGDFLFGVNYDASTLQVIDIADPLSPVLEPSVTLPGSNPESLISIGNYLYVAQSSTDDIAVYDVSKAPNLELITNFSTGSSTQPQYLAKSGNYLFVSLYESDEIASYDVTDPRNPVQLDTFSTSNQPNKLIVRGDYLYWGDTINFGVADITNPSNMVVTDTEATTSDITSVEVNGQYAYVGSDGSGLYVIDVGDPTSIGSEVSYTDGINGAVEDLIIQGKYLYMADRGGGPSQIVTYDISNPDSPVLADNFPVDDSPYHLSVKGQYAYITEYGGSDEVDIYDLSSVYVQQLVAGGLEASTVEADFLTVNRGSDLRGDLTVAGNTNLQGTVNVGGNFSLQGLVVSNIGVGSGATTVTTSNVSTSLSNADDVGVESSTAIGADGLPVVSYKNDTDDDLLITKCYDEDCTSSRTTQVTDANNTGNFTSITIGQDGLPIVAHYEDGTTDDLYVTKCLDIDCINTSTQQISDADDIGAYPSIKIAPDGNPVISHTNVTDGDLMVLDCGNDDCSSGNTNTQVSDGDNTGFHTWLEIGTDGLPIVAYRNVTDGDLQITHCGNDDCSSGNTTTQVTDANNAGFYVAMQIGWDGLPRIAHRDGTDFEVDLVQCTVTNCSTYSENIVDTGTGGDSVGTYIGLAIDQSGNPVLSYANVTDSELTIADCQTDDCSGTPTITQISDANTAGFHSSIVNLPSDLPFIASRDSADGDIDFLRCGDGDCAGTSTSTTGGLNLGSQSAEFQNAYINNIFTGDADSPFTINTNGIQRVSIDNSGNSTFNTNIYLGEGDDRTIAGETRATNAAGRNLTLSAGNAGAGGSAFSGGTLTLQGGDAAGTGNANGGTVSITGGAGIGTGVQGLVNLSTTAFDSAGVQSFGSSGSLTAGLVDQYSTIPIDATAAGVTVTIPAPASGNQVIGRVLYITADDGSNDFEISLAGTSISINLKENSTATLIWNGTGWTAAGASSSTDLQSAYDNTLTSAGGAELVLNAPGGNADGLTIRNNSTTPITGAIFETQTSIGSNLFSVNNNATEFADNGGAEDSTFTMWTGTPDGGTVTRYTTTGDYVATGQASVQVVTTADADEGAENTLDSALTANLEYNVSVAVRSTANFTTLDVVYSPDGTNTGTVDCATDQTVTEGKWSRISCSFTAPSSGIDANNAIFIRQNDATAKTYYVDNLSVNISADATLAADGSVDLALGTNWTAFGTLDALTRETSIIYDTSGSVEVDTPNNADRGVRNNLAIDPSTDTQYLVTFFARSSDTFNDIRVRYTRDGGSNFVSCVDYNTQSVSTAAFTKITCLFTTDSTTATDADLVIDQPTGSDREFYIDALSVTLNTDAVSNVQIGGANLGGPATLFTLDRSDGAPIADNNDAYLGSMYYDTTTGRIQCYEADGWGACGAAPDNVVNLNPEYAGAVLNGSGVGTMTADICSNDTPLSVNSSLCGSGEAKNYYQWTSPQATQQTYSIYVSYQLPETFNGFASDDTVQLFGRVDNTTNASVTYEMYRSTGSAVTQCGSGETDVITGGGGSADTWYSYGINGNEATGCSFTSAAAGDFILFKINLKANDNANAYVSTLSFTTTGR